MCVIRGGERELLAYSRGFVRYRVPKRYGFIWHSFAPVGDGLAPAVPKGGVNVPANGGFKFERGLEENRFYPEAMTFQVS